MRLTVAVAFLGTAAFFSALGSAFFVAATAGLASFLASFTGPEVPIIRQRFSLATRAQPDAYRTMPREGERVRLTLGLRKVTLILARCDRAVDVVPEGNLTEVADLVVGLNVLLDSLTAIGAKVSNCSQILWDEMQHQNQL